VRKLLRLVFVILVTGIFCLAYSFWNDKGNGEEGQQKEAVITNTKESTASSDISKKTKKIRGIELNPMANGALETNREKISSLVRVIKSAGANTIGLYNCGLFDWENSMNNQSGAEFCKKVLEAAKDEKLDVILGYFSNATQDWTNKKTINRATWQFQKLVTETKDYPFIKYYLIGNEVFEKLPNEAAKNNYAQWISLMTKWVNDGNSGKEVIYADNVNLEALPYLKKYNSQFTTYAVNDYEWDGAKQLGEKIKEITVKWPGAKVMLHEWGVDSFDTNKQKENQASQSKRVVELAKEIEKVEKQFPEIFVGALYFSLTDNKERVVRNDKNIETGEPWVCLTCFDKKANEGYWGIYGKPAYEGLKGYWLNN
jgi:hypothetical protein